MAAAATFLPAMPTPRLGLAASFPSSRHLPPIHAGTTDAASPEDEGTGDIYEATPRCGGGGKDRRRAVRIAWEKIVRWSRYWRRRNRSDVLESTRKVVVLGGGSFGTAMAAHVAAKKADLEVAMLLRDDLVCRSINQSHVNCKYLSEHKLPENIVATTSAADALAGADFCFHAVPVQFSSSFLESISAHVDPKLPFISLSKGLELNTLRTMSKIIPKALENPRQPFVVLSGPSFAVELMNKLPTGTMTPFQYENIEQLTGSNSPCCKTCVEVSLGFNQLDYALREDKPTTPTPCVEGYDDLKRTYELKLERCESSNRVALLVMNVSISLDIACALPKKDTTKEFLAAVED